MKLYFSAVSPKTRENGHVLPPGITRRLMIARNGFHSEREEKSKLKSWPSRLSAIVDFFPKQTTRSGEVHQSL